MSRQALVVVILFVTFMPPGLCPCWLMGDVRALHPHPGGFPERSHEHGYLFDIFQSQPAAVVALTTNPVRRLIEQLLHASLWLARHDSALFHLSWCALPPTPPPRFS